MDDTSQIVSVLRYKDAEHAAAWLCQAFGFRRRRVVKDAAGAVRYILLASGRSTLLLRPVSNSDFDDLMTQPENAGQASTQVCYLAVSDLDAHYRRAAIAGAHIELAPGRDGLGGNFYSCRDLEGHVWSFGTHDYRVAPRFAARLRAGARRMSHWVSVITIGAVAAGAWAFHSGQADQALPVETASIPTMSRSDDGGSSLLQRTTAALERAREENSRLAAEMAAVRAHERRQRMIWEQTGAELSLIQEQLTNERKARDAAVADVSESGRELKAVRADLEQQKQQRAAFQEQLQTTMAALVDARREAISAATQPSRIRTETAPPPLPQRAVPARPAEAIACYRQLMRGGVNWGGGTEWLPYNAHALCSGTGNARRTIGCFEAGVRAGQSWRDAINTCRAT
jgi:uncharacterized glyoxalase superfamily protein PhnB